MEEDSFEYILNPLNAYLLIKRLTYDITQTVFRVTGITELFTHNLKTIQLPQSDFEGAVEGLIRLQTIYNLQAEDLASGVIDGKKYRDNLTAGELFALGDELMNTERNSVALSYLNLALDRNRESRDMSDVVILEKIYQNHNKTGNLQGVLQTIQKILEIDPTRVDLNEKSIDLELELLFEKQTNPIDESGYEESPELRDLWRYMEACGGFLRQSDAKIAKLRCRFVSNSDYSKLCPFKVEEANLNPYIAIFHDVMSDDEIQVFKSIAKPNLIRAGTMLKNATTKVRKLLKFLNPQKCDEIFIQGRQCSHCKAQLGQRFNSQSFQATFRSSRRHEWIEHENRRSLANSKLWNRWSL